MFAKPKPLRTHRKTARHKLQLSCKPSNRLKTEVTGSGCIPGHAKCKEGQRYKTEVADQSRTKIQSKGQQELQGRSKQRHLGIRRKASNRVQDKQRTKRQLVCQEGKEKPEGLQGGFSFFIDRVRTVKQQINNCYVVQSKISTIQESGIIVQPLFQQISCSDCLQEQFGSQSSLDIAACKIQEFWRNRRTRSFVRQYLHQLQFIGSKPPAELGVRFEHSKARVAVQLTKDNAINSGLGAAQPPASLPSAAAQTLAVKKHLLDDYINSQVKFLSVLPEAKNQIDCDGLYQELFQVLIQEFSKQLLLNKLHQNKCFIADDKLVQQYLLTVSQIVIAVPEIKNRVQSNLAIGKSKQLSQQQTFILSQQLFDASLNAVSNQRQIYKNWFLQAVFDSFQDSLELQRGTGKPINLQKELQKGRAKVLSEEVQFPHWGVEQLVAKYCVKLSKLIFEDLIDQLF